VELCNVGVAEEGKKIGMKVDGVMKWKRQMEEIATVEDGVDEGL
jgi:hypothetical protein